MGRIERPRRGGERRGILPEYLELYRISYFAGGGYKRGRNSRNALAIKRVDP